MAIVCPIKLLDYKIEPENLGCNRGNCKHYVIKKLEESEQIEVCSFAGVDISIDGLE